MRYGRLLAGALALLLAAGCGGSNDDMIAGDADGGAPDGADAPADPGGDADAPRDAGGEEAGADGEDCVQDLDIVFVLDVSTSMTPVLEALRLGIADVWTAALALSSDPHFGLVVFVDDVNVTNAGGPYPDVARLQTEFGYWRNFCATEREPGGSAGTNTDCPENMIDAVWAAAERFPWREGSLRVVILATDDTFVESPGTLGSASLRVQHTYADLVAALVARQVRVAAFAAHTSVACSIPPVHNTEAGFFTPYGPSPSLGAATGAAVFDIGGVQSGAVSMAEAISGVILDEWCTPFI